MQAYLCQKCYDTGWMINPVFEELYRWEEENGIKIFLEDVKKWLILRGYDPDTPEEIPCDCLTNGGQNVKKQI